MSDINLKIRHAKRQYSQNINLSNMNLEYLPNELFQLKNLITLDLSNNNLKEIDKQLENLLNLKEINLENNLLEDLPKEILNLKNLTNLNLKNNPILTKLKDFDIYWKSSLKIYFNELEKLTTLNNNNNIFYTQTDTNFLNKTSKNSFSNLTFNNNISTLKDLKNSNIPNENLIENEIKPNSKHGDLKGISFANININSNINLPNIQNNINLSALRGSSTNNNVIKDQDGSVKNRKITFLKNSEENNEKDFLNSTNYNNVNNNSRINSDISENKNNLSGNNLKFNTSTNKDLNNTVSNFNFNNNPLSNNTNSFFGKKNNSGNNIFQKISPVSLKAENQNHNRENSNNSYTNYNDNDFKSSSFNLHKNSPLKNLSTEKNLINNNFSNISSENYNNISENKNSAMDDLEKKLNLKDEIINSLNLKICELEQKIISINNNKIPNKNIQNISSKPVEDVISNKRNWMDNNTSNDQRGVSLDNSIFISNVNSTGEKSAEDYKELENKLQKEVLNSKRMKNQIDKLSQQIVSSQNIFNSKSEDLLKKIKEINYDELEIKTQIGQGGFSIIYKGIWLNIPIAVKVLFDPNVNEDLLNEFNNEIKMLFLLRHPNIISLLGTSKNQQKLVIITEYLENGSLFDFLHKPGKEINLTNKIKIKLIKQILNAMLYMHSNDIVHRDLKSHNILLDENYNIKLCDFGLARVKSDLNTGTSKFSGTPAYMAPEILQKKSYDEKIDVFAFGTLIWEILTRKIPYEGVEIVDLKQRLLSDEKLFIPKSIPKDLGNIIEMCRHSDPSKRPGFAQISKMQIDL